MRCMLVDNKINLVDGELLRAGRKEFNNVGRGKGVRQWCEKLRALRLL